MTTYAELRQMSKDELIEQYDGRAQSAGGGLDFYRQEIARRDAEEQTAAIISMTRQMRNLTIVITVLTAITTLATVLVVCDAMK